VGASVPVIPFFFLRGTPAVVVAAGAAGLVLAAVGGVVGFLSGTRIWRSVLRMVGLAAVAAGITYAVGKLFGAAVS
jgi:VIT1/CCC1 family predicted Fe2+/Mn2+ transporter